MQARIIATFMFFLPLLPAVALADDFCASGQWSLTGAQAQAEDLGAVYAPEWDDDLTKLAACMAQSKRDCLIIQGHFDAIPIPKEIARVFASQEVAQQARARGRSTAVFQRLVELGVAGDRLREAAPGTSPTFRGVRLTLDAACRSDLTAEEHAELDRRRSEVEAAHREVQAAQKSVDDERERLAQERDEAKREEAKRAYPAESQGTATPTRAVAWFGQVGAQGAVGLAKDGPTTWMLGPRAALGINYAWFTMFAGEAINFANQSAQSKGVEFFASAGAKPVAWLTLGPTVGVRYGSSAFFSSWLTRSWYAGLFVSEELRLSKQGSLIFEQAALPFGREQVRGAVIGGVDVWTPSHTARFGRFELGVAYRYYF